MKKFIKLFNDYGYFVCNIITGDYICFIMR